MRTAGSRKQRIDAGANRGAAPGGNAGPEEHRRHAAGPARQQGQAQAGYPVHAPPCPQIIEDQHQRG
jgi:hypothetical protein